MQAQSQSVQYGSTTKYLDCTAHVAKKFTLDSNGSPKVPGDCVDPLTFFLAPQFPLDQTIVLCLMSVMIHYLKN